MCGNAGISSMKTILGVQGVGSHPILFMLHHILSIVKLLLG